MMKQFFTWINRHLWAQGVLSLLLVLAITWLLPPEQSVAAWLLRSLMYTAISMGFIVYRRRKDQTAVADDRVDVMSVDRKLWKGQIPDDPGEQQAMRRLVARRRHQLRHQHWAAPLLAVIVLGIVVLSAFTGAWAAALGLLAFGLVLGGWLTVASRRQRRNMRHMERALN